MAFWASSGGDPDPSGKLRPAIAADDTRLREDEMARDKYAQAFGAAYSWGPTAQASFVNGATINRNDLAARGYQDAHAARLASIASGGPGGTAVPAAQANLASAQKLNTAYAASKPTGNVAATMRLAGNTNQAQGATSAARVAMLGEQEKLAAYAALNPALASMRQQDFGAANEQAKLQAQANLANAGFSQNVALANQQAWDKRQALSRAALGSAVGFDVGAFNDTIARRRALLGESNWRNQFDMESQARKDAQQATYLDTAARGAGYLASAYSEDDDKYKKLGGG